MIAEIIISALIIIGVSFSFVGSLGLVKLPDFYMRVHVPTKATTLGIGSLLIASTIFFSIQRGAPAVHEILIVLFLFMTAPISAHMLMKAGLHERLKDVDGEVGEKLGTEKGGGDKFTTGSSNTATQAIVVVNNPRFSPVRSG